VTSWRWRHVKARPRGDRRRVPRQLVPAGSVRREAASGRQSRPSSGIPEIAYSVLQERWTSAAAAFSHRRCHRDHVPLQSPLRPLLRELTGRSREIQEKELSLERLKRLIDEIVAAAPSISLFTAARCSCAPTSASSISIALRQGPARHHLHERHPRDRGDRPSCSTNTVPSASRSPSTA